MHTASQSLGHGQRRDRAVFFLCDVVVRCAALFDIAAAGAQSFFSYDIFPPASLCAWPCTATCCGAPWRTAEIRGVLRCSVVFCGASWCTATLRGVLPCSAMPLLRLFTPRVWPCEWAA
uniref:Uncharacterized protein n=1 Tax=Chlamydomonas euryale TaxID=1486919 RepID=A0A7R9VJZ2_9CHLO|mmetsp:Transcript_37734/g.111686  ORF Transcript_37734/g.111686 Transcript_37734/m.111686 type:complete len:119 (+) Transcript_37734:659-1015(+)